VANAEKTYVDPSALRSAYVHDVRSAKFAAWRRRVGGAVPVTRFGRSEVVNSILLGVHRGLLVEDEARGAIADFEADLREGRLRLVDALWRRTLDIATDLSERHTVRLGTRTLDVLHVATALTLDMTHFVSYDERQRSLAKAAGLRVLAP
jgi:predicted nucleic acid-binding protein